MVQTLRVDVIYHKTASDFEMEFNLGGCCRMRLLSDKTDNKKEFVNALARDVSRSRVIIACGPLFGADGLIKIVSLATGSGTAYCDNITYGINGDEKIEILNGSTPLVTPDGYFGGCIIEKGFQTIILLTENKTFRKAIMQNLIHPYLEEISYVSQKNTLPVDFVQEPDNLSTEQPNTNEFLTTPDDDYGEDEFEENAYEVAPTPNDEHNIEFIMDGGDADETELVIEEQTLTEYDTYNMYTEVESPEEIEARYENPYTPSEDDNLFITSVDNDTDIQTKNKKDTRSLDIAIVVLVLMLLLAVLALVYFIVLKPMTFGVSTGEYLKQIFGTASARVHLL